MIALNFDAYYHYNELIQMELLKIHFRPYSYLDPSHYCEANLGSQSLVLFSSMSNALGNVEREISIFSFCLILLRLSLCADT